MRVAALQWASMTPQKRAAPWAEPSAWLVANAKDLPHEGDALDVACGSGRHALWLAERGLRVRAVDNDPEALRALRAAAAERGLEIEAEVLDLEGGPIDLGQCVYALIVVLDYLHRPLFPVLMRALAPGGVLVYQTFLEGHSASRPSRPEHLLKPRELVGLVSPTLEVLAEREGEFDGRLVASILARAPADLGPVSRG
jgi:SAM-dependent methyltransferase